MSFPNQKDTYGTVLSFLKYLCMESHFYQVGRVIVTNDMSNSNTAIISINVTSITSLTNNRSTGGKGNT